MSRSLMNSRMDSAVPDKTEDITRIMIIWMALTLSPGTGVDWTRPKRFGVARTRAPSRIGISTQVAMKTRSATITRRYLRAMVKIWSKLLRCLGRADCSPSGRPASSRRWRTEIGVAMYFTKSGDARYSPAKSRSGSSANRWKTSAQSPALKYFRPSLGGPK
jgi:hypothetical protein